MIQAGSRGSYFSAVSAVAEKGINETGSFGRDLDLNCTTVTCRSGRSVSVAMCAWRRKRNILSHGVCRYCDLLFNGESTARSVGWETWDSKLPRWDPGRALLGVI